MPSKSLTSWPRENAEMRALRGEIPHAPDAALQGAVLEVRGEDDRPLVLLEHEVSLILSPTAPGLVRVEPSGRDPRNWAVPSTGSCGVTPWSSSGPSIIENGIKSSNETGGFWSGKRAHQPAIR